MERPVAALGELTVRLDHDDGVVVLDRDLEVVEVVFLEEAGLPDRALDERFGGRSTVLLQEAGVERTGVDTDAEAHVRGLRSLGDFADLVVERLDVAGVHANRGTSGVNRLEDVLRLEVDVRDDGNLALFRDDVEDVGVFLRGDSDTNDVASRGGELRDLLECAVDVGRLGRCHRLDGNLCVAADEHLSNLDLTRLATRCERLDDAGKSNVYSHASSVLR